MKTVWTNHLPDQEEKTKFYTSLRHSRWILDRQKDILTSIGDNREKQELSLKAYDKPNWQARTAHSNGFKECLQLVKDLITLDQKEYNDRFTEPN